MLESDWKSEPCVCAVFVAAAGGGGERLNCSSAQECFSDSEGDTGSLPLAGGSGPNPDPGKRSSLPHLGFVLKSQVC